MTRDTARSHTGPRGWDGRILPGYSSPKSRRLPLCVWVCSSGGKRPPRPSPGCPPRCCLGLCVSYQCPPPPTPGPAYSRSGYPLPPGSAPPALRPVSAPAPPPCRVSLCAESGTRPFPVPWPGPRCRGYPWTGC